MPYNITEIMDTWITQRHFPELKVDCDNNTGSIILSVYTCNETRWKIPITYVIISNRTFVYNTPSKILFDCLSNVYTFETDMYDFIIVNVEQMGYYRVNYDSNNWVKISTHLIYHNYTQINVLNRAQLIDDAYYFVINGKHDVNTFLYLLKYLKRESHYVAWYSMFNIFT
ncbi:aminopeptidase N-like [Odontomachus brunneus]|nr:aminopeptidase N-like [Odontomachus brunneus]